ncbi:MAG: anhydro-N-acetylmuramic acid kinase [candidate division Zixibacteria bacterium]|nr:anhydro-N-acetylmuramic acid kinase [candidate division Zixibacteria bacterium]
MPKKVCLKDKIKLKQKTIIGLNSGTSADGVDTAIIRISGSGFKSRVKFISGRLYKFDKRLRSKIKKYAEPDYRDAEEWLKLDIELAEFFSKAALKAIKSAGLKTDDIDLIGSHGQTIRHMPDTKWGTITCQLAEPARIAVRTGIITVGDFRVADTAAGGQGAPLTPIVNAILFGQKHKNIGMLNIGGIANITHIAPDKHDYKIFGCDTGPGNMLVDYLTKKLYEKDYDLNGRLALKGKVDYSIIKNMLNRKFFSIKGPKSTGRETFGKAFAKDFLSVCRKKRLNKYDIIAAASQFTIEAVKYCLQINKLNFDEIIISGGGAKNNYFQDALSQAFKQIKITASIDYGFDMDYLEAISFAVLANEALCSNRYRLKNITGAQKAVVLGKICQS